MAQTFVFDAEEAFVAKVRELRTQGITSADMDLYMPSPPHGLEEVLAEKESPLRFFALGGATSGFVVGLCFTIFTALWWPLITGGKPIVSLPPYLLIGYILTILFGAVVTFGGFLLLARLPSISRMTDPQERFTNQFVIVLRGREDQP